MTDLISRPKALGGSGAAPEPRPLSAAAAVGGAVAAASTLVVCMSIALTGWFLADAGGHGQTTDALRVGANGWLLGHGADLTVAGTPFAMTPLAITVILVIGAFRAARWSARSAAEITEDRSLAGGVGTFACAYLVVLVLVAVITSQPGATSSMPRGILGALVISLLAGGLGLASGTGRLEFWLDRAPAWSREVMAGGIAGALTLLAAAAVLVAGSLLLSFNEAATALSELNLSTGDAVAYTAVAALLAPNAVLFSAAYLVGPGFAVGTGTSVAPTAVSLGVVPAFPMLAALPDEGPTPGWLVLVMAIPAIAAWVGVGSSRRGAEPLPLDIAAIRGAGAGFLAGILITVAISLSGGPMGTGRLAEIGAPTAEVLVFATGLMSMGGLLGGVSTTLAQRWSRKRRG